MALPPMPAAAGRTRARVLGAQRWARLLSLPQFAEVHERLRDGQTCAQVARLIQHEWQSLLDLRTESLVTQLGDYRREVIGLVARFPETPEAERLREHLDAELRERVDVVERYEFLTNALTWRLRRQLAREQAGAVVPELIDTAGELRHLLREYGAFLGEHGQVGAGSATSVVPRWPASFTSEDRDYAAQFTPEAAEQLRQEVRAYLDQRAPALAAASASASVLLARIPEVVGNGRVRE